MMETLGVKRSDVRPDTRFAELIPRWGRKKGMAEAGRGGHRQEGAAGQDRAGAMGQHSGMAGTARAGNADADADAVVEIFHHSFPLPHAALCGLRQVYCARTEIPRNSQRSGT